MSNQFQMRCPKCKSADQIDIEAIVWVRLTEDGTDADASNDGGHTWDDGSAATCAACGCSGTVFDFDSELEGAA